ncbi:hypothetical protein N9W41_00475 [bacterium]|nr:hypothetical protein [bacterium]
MNVKTITNNLSSIVPQKKTEDTKAVKSEHSQDRDADGRKEREEQPKKEHFTDEEVLRALNYLKNLEGIKTNNLQVSFENTDSQIIFYLKEPSGKVIRRLIGPDVWNLMISEAEKGHLLDKAM